MPVTAALSHASRTIPLSHAQIETALEAIARGVSSSPADASRSRAAAWVSFANPVAPPVARVANIGPEHGAQVVSSVDQLLALAQASNIPGATGKQAVKFLIVGATTNDPQLYLVNGKTYPYHYFFYHGAGLGPESVDQFEKDTYVFFESNPPIPHQNIAGTLVYHPNYKDAAGQPRPLVTFGFWPTDRVEAKDINLAQKAVRRALDFDGVDIAYVPAGDTHNELLELYRNELDPAVQIKQNDELYANVDFRAMNAGVSFGFIRNAPPQTLGPRDIAIFETNPPNDGIGHLPGFITGEHQNEGSHLALLAAENSVPNAMIKDPLNDPKLRPFINTGVPVRFEVTAEGFSVREASGAELDEYFDAIRPMEEVQLTKNLTKKEVRDFEDPDFGIDDADAYGGKSAGIGEMWNMRGLDDIRDDQGRTVVKRVKGRAAPFDGYQQFMDTAKVPDGRTFTAYAEAMLKDPVFQSDAVVRRERLEQFRDWIVETDFPPELAVVGAKLDKVWAERVAIARDPAARPEDVNVRARSSAAGEDAAGSSMAGVGTSFTNRQDEDIKETSRQVFASFWNFEAVEERHFLKADHLSGAMGVTYNENFSDETGNGVAFTRNDIFPGWRGNVIRVQAGDRSVTNPEPGEVSDSFLVANLSGTDLECLYSSKSNFRVDGKPVLSERLVEGLNTALDVIHAHMAKKAGRADDPTYGVDVEFEVEGTGDDAVIWLKQQRPMVDPAGNPAEDERRAVLSFAAELSGGQPLGADQAAALVEHVRGEFAGLHRPWVRGEPNPKTTKFGIRSALGEISANADAKPLLAALGGALDLFLLGANVDRKGQDVAAVVESAKFDGLDGNALREHAMKRLQRLANGRQIEGFSVDAFQPVVQSSLGRITFAAESRSGRTLRAEYAVDGAGNFVLRS